MYAKKVDRNQKEIVAAIRALGLTVVLLHAVGRGFPDLLVSSATTIWLVEVKAKKGTYTEAQEEFYSKWKGKPILTIRDVKEVSHTLFS